MSHRARFGVVFVSFVAAACSSTQRTEVASVQATAQVAVQSAQAPAVDVETYRATVDALVHDAMNSGMAFEFLHDLCTKARHRLSGSEDAATAIEWAQGAMNGVGLANVHTEPVMVPHWSRGNRAELTATSSSERWNAAGGLATLAILALGGSVGTPDAGLTGGVVEVKNFDDLHALGDKAKGKFVFFNRPMDRSKDPFAAYGGAVDQRGHGAVEAAKVGAIGAIVRSMTMSDDDFPHTGGMGYDDGVAKVPAVAVSTKGADQLSSMLKTDADIKLTLNLDCKWLDDAQSFNVIGDVVGSEKPDEIVVVGGHLDNWDVGQGANDDGAGIVHSLEAARLINELPRHPKRTIRVVFFINEENGARGATAYYEAHKGEMDKHVLALESDRGGFSPRGFETDASPESLATLREIATVVKPLGIDWVEPGHGGTDIGPMARSGVITVGFVPDPQRYFDFHHSDRDTLDNVHPRELELGAAAIAGFLYVVADMPTALPHNPPPPPKAETK
jgi:Zn-dependent M28 family amino/carboxypeptidase